MAGDDVRAGDDGRADASPARSPWAVLTTVMVGTLLIGLDRTIINLAIPDVIKDFDITVSTAGWLATAYIISNAVFVPVFGKLGDMIGDRRVYTAGMFGFLVSAAFHNYSLGASGGLLGLVGAMLAITTKRGGSYMRELRSRLVTSVVILFVLGFSGLGMDNYAHFAGMVAGFGLGKLFVDRQPINANERRTAYALGWLAGIVVLASFVLMILHYRDPLPWQR